MSFPKELERLASYCISQGYMTGEEDNVISAVLRTIRVLTSKLNNHKSRMEKLSLIITQLRKELKQSEKEKRQLVQTHYKQFSGEDHVIYIDGEKMYVDSIVAPVTMTADEFREFHYARKRLKEEFGVGTYDG